MANAMLLVPHIFHWEDSVPYSYATKPLEEQFKKAKEKGLVLVPGDKGGYTVCGIILSTYTAYRQSQGYPRTTKEDLLNMTADDWFHVYKYMFWDKCGGDYIGDQRVANMFVDWVWTSGPGQIKKVQNLVGVTGDGIVGPETIYTINTWHPVTLFEELKNLRIKFYESIVINNPTQGKFLKGWVNRVNAL